MLGNLGRIPSPQVAQVALMFANIAGNETVGLIHARESYRSAWKMIEADHPQLWSELNSNDGTLTVTHCAVAGTIPLGPGVFPGGNMIDFVQRRWSIKPNFSPPDSSSPAVHVDHKAVSSSGPHAPGRCCTCSGGTFCLSKSVATITRKEWGEIRSGRFWSFRRRFTIRHTSFAEKLLSVSRFSFLTAERNSGAAPFPDHFFNGARGAESCCGFACGCGFSCGLAAGRGDEAPPS